MNFLIRQSYQLSLPFLSRSLPWSLAVQEHDLGLGTSHLGVGRVGEHGDNFPSGLVHDPRAHDLHGNQGRSGRSVQGLLLERQSLIRVPHLRR